MHRSLMQRDLVLGIPSMGMLILLLLGVFTMYILKQYYFGVIIAALYIAMRIMTKKDPYLIDILIEHVNQKDYLVP
ncbi:VirB3 family type IV secretion system protein [Treponema zuelzerae]|uniref:VirB3 family type IV secretion system protein n=1 Tax=Teretinema zuelzerae TaxID=156 RepID=A0AAE3JL19_9SPIR|nr:VirB3 family type IV secretion system protein [Teretinema zuelzerae]MCD1654434.1 VirB3 family type IV secretion system protein [Teretinema zuelzerae]